MARRGRFGRSGTSQNLTMLVYQLMKQQMQDELESILTSYKTNMEAGMYKSQFNGQNVDGEFVIQYYEQMLAGFPPGSTEYETVNSKLEQFRQQYQQDVENLVINSMNNGSKIDFGLLGSGFQNKGIAEVELVDVRSWAEDRIQQLIADGNTTQADKLGGAVYIAGFKVEHDNKVAMVDKGEMSYSAYAKWLKGQMGSALDSGLTQSSEAYREIMKLHANAVKQAKVEGEANAEKSVVNQMIEINKPVENASRLLIESYLKGDNPVMAQAIYDSIAKTGTYYGALEDLAALRQEGDQSFNAIMSGSGVEGAAEIFAEAIADKISALRDLRKNGLGGLSPSANIRLSAELLSAEAGGNAFVSNSGVQFFTGAGRVAMDKFEDSLIAAGASVSSGGSGTAAISGGHPVAGLDSFKQLGESLKSFGGEAAYPWLTTMAQGYISTDLDPESLGSMDPNRDGKVTVPEMQEALRNGTQNLTSLSSVLNNVIASSGSLDAPVGRITPESIVNMYANFVYGDYQIKERGAIVVTNAAGVVTVTEDNNNSFPNALPFALGQYGIVHVLPTSIVEKTENEQTSPIDRGKLGGMDAAIYRYPGIGPSASNVGAYDAMVRVNGQMSTGDGYKVQKSILVPFDIYRKVLDHIGIEVEANSLFNPQPDQVPQLIVRFDGQTMSGTELSTFMADVFTNPSSQYHILKLKDDLGKPLAPEAAGIDFTNNGFINPDGDTNSYINALFNAGRDSILRRAQDKIAANAPGVALSREALIQDIVNSVPGLSGGIQDTTIKDLIVNSETFQNKINTMFPEFKPAPVMQPSPSGYGQTVKPPAPTPATSAPYQNLYTQGYTQGQSFLNGAFRNAGGLGMNPTNPNLKPPQAQIQPATPTSVPKIGATKPAPYKPPTPPKPSTATAKPKVTQSGVTTPTGNVNTGYTRGLT